MTPADKERIFNGLVSNGLRHLKRGLEGFESEHLDFAVTDAFFGFEIILKALVFQRDWQQILKNPASADPVKLMRGECHTIGCADSIKRLELLGLILPRSVTHFKILEQHRNKLVHYFHPDLATEHRRRRIASELANAWGSLRTLRAISDISSALTPHEAEFGRLDGRLLVLNRYLDQQAVHLRADYAHPDRLVDCPACKRETFDGDCILCSYSEPSHRELTQGAEAIGPADCPRCGAGESVVVSGAGARCTQSDCGAWFGGMYRCEFCQEFFVVENESELIDDEDHAGTGSYQFGCEKCDGNFGYQMSKDD